jgi:purine-binding chemotaxis protein CheW
MLGDECYALSLHALREIVKVPPLTEVPRSEPELLGVMNLRGEVIPVYDLELRLGLTRAPAPIAGPDANLAALPKGTRVLVVKSEEGAAGVRVDSVSGVVRLRPSAIEAPPRTGWSGLAVATTGSTS